jgi:hypothetical protein
LRRVAAAARAAQRERPMAVRDRLRDPRAHAVTQASAAEQQVGHEAQEAPIDLG